MPQTVEVRFKGTRKGFYRWQADDEPLRLNDPVLVEAERGQDFGRVSATGEKVEKKCAGGCNGCAVGTSPEDAAVRAVVRRASQPDVAQANELRRHEEETRRTVVARVRHHGLDMKVSDTEWQWDRNKLTIFFTAEQRVDFRSLVRDLAAQFRTRIELRQIGVRDEAARLGGVGRCGREYCCSSWLTELSPVNLALAKDQHLSLNPSQISGGCGRLLCCLKYEHEFYVTARKRFPKEGKTVNTARGPERVVAVDIFRERVFLRSDEHGSRIIPLLELREEMDDGGAAPAPQPLPRPPEQSHPAQQARPRRERRPESPKAESPQAEPPKPPAPIAAAPEAAPPGEPSSSADSRSAKRRRRRRRRGPGGSGGAGPASPGS